MLSFIIPVAHPENMGSPARRMRMLLRTINSVSQQDSESFNVIVVGPPSALPAELQMPEKVHLLGVNFPPAGAQSRPTWAELWRDKGAKLAVGISYARRQGSLHVMAVDSDDYVSRRLAGFVANYPDSDGWFSQRGYLHVAATRKLLVVDGDFHMKCGSSHIIRVADHPVPADVDSTASRSNVVAHVGEDVVHRLLGAHRSIIGFLEASGSHLEPLPFPGAVWEIGSGENYTKLLHFDAESIEMNSDIAKEFGLAVPSFWRNNSARLSNIARRGKRKLTRDHR